MEPEFVNAEMQELELVIERAAAEFSRNTGIVVDKIELLKAEGIDAYSAKILYRRF